MGGIFVSAEIIEKVKSGLNGIEIGYFHTGIGCNIGKAAYYKYFDDPYIETRRYAIAAFTIYLGDSYTGCAHHFINRESYLAEYIKAFIEHHQQIEKDFPSMFECIIQFLSRNEEGNNRLYENATFRKMEEKLYLRLKQEVLIPKREYLNKNTPMGYFLKEIRVKPFLKNDFIEEEH